MNKLTHLMQREFRNDFDALRAAEAGMKAQGELVTINPIEPGNLEFGRHRVYWRRRFRSNPTPCSRDCWCRRLSVAAEGVILIWTRSHRAHYEARLVADRHYNRQKPGTSQFVPPGRCFVLYAAQGAAQALWVTSWPFAEYVKHDWPGAWICSAFRNEGAGIASELIRDAVAATLFHYGSAPPLGMVTFIDERKVRPTIVRSKPAWGWTYKQAGFKEVGRTRGGLLALQLLPEDMPKAEQCLRMDESLPLF